MNRLLKGMLAALMVTSLAACSSGEPENSGESGIPEDYVTIQVNTDGLGIIAAVNEGEKPEIDESNPTSSIVQNVEKGTVLVLGAAGREGWKFSKWTKDGSNYSEDTEITITADADAEYIAVFHLDTGWEGESVTDIKDAKVIGDILGLPSLGNACFEDKYVTAFELNGVTYRVIADISSDLAHQIWDLDFDDPDYAKKEMDLIKDLEISQADNLAELAEGTDVSAFVGKTGAELIEAGFRFNGYYADEQVFISDYGVGSYRITCEGTPDSSMDDLDEMISPLTVVSVEYDGIGDFAGDLEY